MQKNPMDHSKRILIVLIAGIGDLVLASKAIRSLYHANKSAVSLSLLTSSEAAILARTYPYFGQIYAFPIRELRKEKSSLLDIARLVKKLRMIDYDEIVNLYLIGSKAGALKMGLLFSACKAKAKIGHDRYGFGHFLTDKLPAELFTDCHVVDAMQEIALKAGGVPDDHGIELFWKPEAPTRWEPFFRDRAGQSLVGIHPGGDRANRRWAPERFAAVANQLIERFNAHIILLGGPAERGIASSVQSRIPANLSTLAGAMPLDELPYVVSRLDLLLTNDSGPMHIAAATGTPLVALFGPEDPRLFGPYTTPDKYRVIKKDAPCLPCKNEKCRQPICLDRITPDEVLSACLDMLRYRSKE